jgi:TetR/AcrR family transcriptional repressor of lmrAB and yxaGH operons
MGQGAGGVGVDPREPQGLLRRDELVSSNYREGCAIAPIVIESTPASDHLSDAARRAFQDQITTLSARLTEKGVPRDRALQLATNVWSSVEGALILSRALRSPEPFDTAIALLTAAAGADADASIS